MSNLNEVKIVGENVLKEITDQVEYQRDFCDWNVTEIYLGYKYYFSIIAYYAMCKHTMRKEIKPEYTDKTYDFFLESYLTSEDFRIEICRKDIPCRVDFSPNMRPEGIAIF